MARHVAHLFTRDPLVIFGDQVLVFFFEYIYMF